MARLRLEFGQAMRKVAVDALQSANYFDASQYDPAFENAERACRGALAMLKEIRARLDSGGPKS